jgi:hypothetical protein
VARSGEDRRDTELVSASFWPGSLIDHRVFAGSFEEYLAWVVPGSPTIPATQHVLGQSVFEGRSDTALVEMHVTSYHRVPVGDGDRDAVIGGRYLDWLEKRCGEWRIAQRTMLYDWYQDFGQPVDWSEAVLGMPLRTARPTSRGQPGGNPAIAHCAGTRFRLLPRRVFR